MSTCTIPQNIYTLSNREEASFEQQASSGNSALIVDLDVLRFVGDLVGARLVIG